MSSRCGLRDFINGGRAEGGELAPLSGHMQPYSYQLFYIPGQFIPESCDDIRGGIKKGYYFGDQQMNIGNSKARARGKEKCLNNGESTRQEGRSMQMVPKSKTSLIFLT